MNSEFDRNTSKIERAIARRLIGQMLAAGLVVSVNDGEETTVVKSRDERGILAALATTEHDVITGHDSEGRRIGSFVLIWGNDEDLISDYTNTPEAVRLAVAAEAGVSP